MDPYVTSTPNSTKLPILDTGKFEQWKFRIQQYLQHEHYALWEVIEFGDSYRAPAQDKSVSGEATPSSRSKGRTVAVTAEDMQKRRNDVKARTTLLLALPDEHQLRFSKYETAKELWEAILRTFGGNEATKKTKKNLLKQQYGNFKAEGSETLEQTFNRLQAIVSQLEFLDVPVEQEDLNQKFLTSLSPEWLMHTIVWRNRNDLDTMSLDDLYNHLKVYESEVQKKGGSSSQNMAFISSSNTNSGKSEVPTAQSFSTASGQVTTASTEVATATFSHDTICAYIATQQSGSQIKYEDITQIDDDDIEEMDIKWNMALLSMRADRFWKKTGKKITIQGSDVAGFDKSKVECFNCHKLGHFARECRAPRSQDRSRRESYKKEPKVEEPSHKAMMAIDGIGWDWSFMAEENEASENQALVAEEVVPTEFALMAMSSSSSDNEVYDDSYCSKSCRKNTENLTTKISKLREELFDSESDLCNYKRGLSQVEARLVEFKINESKFCEKIRVLERDLELKDYKIENLTNELEEVKKERDGIDSKLEKFVNSSKDLDQMLESQKSGKDKKGVGFDEYRAVPPPPAQVYSSPMPDLSWTGLPEFADNTVTDYTRPTPSVDVTNDVRSELDGNNLTVCEHGGTSSNAVSKPIINFVKESGCPNVIKINNIENARKPTAKYAELYRNITQSSNVRSNNFGPPIIEDWDSEDESDTESTPIESIRSTINQNRDQPRGNQRNWNNLKSQQLGKDFVMQNKACYKCGSFEHLKVNCNKNKWVNKGKNWSRVNYTQGNLTPKAILLKSGTKTIAPNRSFSTARTSLNVAQPKMKSFVKSAHSNVKRPFERKAVAKNKIWVPTVRTKNPTVGLKVPTAKPTVAAAKGNKGKAVKASARWIWKPKQISGEGSNVNGVSGKPLDNIDDKGFWDSGCSRHMTGNISYLSDYEPYDGGYVSFGYGGGKITGKGTIKTGKLEFENVHFVKELKYNLFSVSQICDNKNCVLFTDSECIVLGRDFKLEDDRHVLLRTPRQQNMYVILKFSIHDFVGTRPEEKYFPDKKYTNCCMRTRSSLEYTIPRRRNCRRSRHRQEAIPLNLDPIPMADDRPMAEQLQAPTGGFESAIVVPIINAQNFELKSSLINLVQNRIFRGGNDEEPHAHIRHFESITNNQRYPDVPNTTIKLLLFPFSLDGVAKTWLEKEPPNSILTWDDLVSKFINFFFPPSKTTNLRNEITNFRQIAQESFSEAWERFKELLRKCPHHGFSLMHQLDTFYNSLSYNDQDSLNSAAGGNFLYKSPNEGLQIIENKAKVRCSRNAVMRVSTNAPPTSSNSSSNFEFHKWQQH
ncbi:ribonuclease H-like domain-containing protein [Tanacetum coccineum]